MSKMEMFKDILNMVSKYTNLSSEVEEREFYHTVLTKVINMSELKDYIYLHLKELERLGKHVEYNIDYSIEQYKVSLILHVRLLREYFEVSDPCNELNDEELEDEEFEKLFNKCLERELKFVNLECVRYIDLNLVDNNNDITIKSRVIECNEDYCRCGNEFKIEVKDIDIIRVIMKLLTSLNNIVNIIRYIHIL